METNDKTDQNMIFDDFESYWEWFKATNDVRHILTIYEEEVARYAFNAGIELCKNKQIKE